MNLNEGDILTRPIGLFGFFEHWGFVAYRDVLGRCIVRSKYAGGLNKQDETLEEFSKGKPVINLGKINDSPINDIIDKTSADNTPYNLLTNNCESFCRKAYGQSGVSSQVVFASCFLAVIGVVTYVYFKKGRLA